MTQDLIDQLRGLLARATPGPWESRIEPQRYPECDDADFPATINGAGQHIGFLPERYAADLEQVNGIDAELIVAAVNALPGLLDTIEVQARGIEALEVGLANIRRDRDRVVELLVKRTDRLAAAEDERDAAIAALKPFQVSIRPEIPDDEVIGTIAHTAGDYRRAALHIRDGE
jgi:hypothetical protein